jgi:hypothetical protein
VATLAAACDSPPATQPEDFDTANVTVTDPGVAPGALGNESANYSEGNVTPAEREPIRAVEQQSPEQFVAAFANLLVQRRFDEAYQMWDPQAADFSAEQLASAFEWFETINPAIQQPGAGQGGSAQGAGGSQVQMTLTGTRKNGEDYTVTGPVTVVRVGGGQSAAGQQGQWRIAKVVLTANAQAADALVQQ